MIGRPHDLFAANLGGPKIVGFGRRHRGGRRDNRGGRQVARLQPVGPRSHRGVRRHRHRHRLPRFDRLASDDMQQSAVAQTVLQRVEPRRRCRLRGRRVGIMPPTQRHVGGGRQRDQAVVGTIVLWLFPGIDPAVVLPAVHDDAVVDAQPRGRGRFLVAQRRHRGQPQNQSAAHISRSRPNRGGQSPAGRGRRTARRHWRR